MLGVDRVVVTQADLLMTIGSAQVVVDLVDRFKFGRVRVGAIRSRPRFGVNDYGPGSWLVRLGDGSDSVGVGDLGELAGSSDRGWRVEQLVT